MRETKLSRSLPWGGVNDSQFSWLTSVAVIAQFEIGLLVKKSEH